MCGIGRAVPGDHEALGHTSEAAAAVRLIRIADVRSGTVEQEDGVIHKSNLSARGKPTKVDVDDEGRSGFRSANGLTPGVTREAAQKIEKMALLVECSLRRVNCQTGVTRRHLSAVAMRALTSGHNSEQVTRYSPL